MIKSIIHNPASFVSKSTDFKSMMQHRKVPKRTIPRVSTRGSNQQMNIMTGGYLSDNQQHHENFGQNVVSS